MPSKPILTLAQIFFTFIMYAIGIIVIGVTLFPSVYLIFTYWTQSVQVGFACRILGLSFVIAFGYFLFGLLMIFSAGITQRVLCLNVKEGVYPIGSLTMMRWMMSGALLITVRFVFMDFMLLTPFCAFFYRIMGAKLGNNVQINSTRVGDLGLLEIGDGSVIGGNSTVIAHLFEKKGLVIKKVKIGKKVIVGLNSIVMPGAEIGDGAVIDAGAIVPKDTKVEAGTIFYGATRNK